ncbi:hypothetical protein FRC01_010026 [Tulasnella sp. 417]|nr:hypothetical protein FRC01_010026 [Tulasnella sp. 417]
MAGGARHALKAKLTTAQAARAAAGGNGAWVWTERRNSPQVKPPRSPTDVLETEGRKRQQWFARLSFDTAPIFADRLALSKAESDFEASHALRKQKKRRLSISHEDSNAVASTPRTSKREDQDKEIAQNITSQPDGGPLCRGVVASNIQTAIGQPSLRTTITIGGVSYLLEDKLVLPPGATIQFGNGETYLYYGPELLTLYSEEKNVYGGKNLNSSVTRVKRLSDKVPFVAKKIDYSHIQMARTEIAVCRAVNHHPRIVQFIEAFYERDSGTHHLIFEAGYMDLYQYARQLRPRGQKIINANAPQWIEQITCGIEYLHRHNMAHRDIKPQNIIVFASKTGMTMKLGDMGIARPHTEPIVENWFAGTKRWTAPGSFMAFGDDRLVDCYGVGRLLFFLLTTYPWPEESRASNRGCNCLDACDGLCARRQAGFEAVKAAGAGKESRDLLKRLLVGFPSQCMNALEILDHPYLANAKSNSEEY